MTSKSLTFGREHLSVNRRMIVGRSIASALAGLMPLPLIDDWLSSRVRRGTIRRIADMRGVDMDDDAVEAIADGPSAPPSWSRIAGVTFLVKAIGRSWRKLIVTYVATQRAKHAAHQFQVATLFDHYCARLHVGLGLDRERGYQVRKLISQTIADTDGGIGTSMFRRGIIASAKATARAPAELLDIASGGRLRKMLTRGDEVEAIAEVDDAIAQSMEGEHGFLARAANAVEVQLSAEGNPYLEELISQFETRWRESRERDE